MTGEWPGRELSANDCAEILLQTQSAGFPSCQVIMPLSPAPVRLFHILHVHSSAAKTKYAWHAQLVACMLHGLLMPLRARPWGEGSRG